MELKGKLINMEGIGAYPPEVLIGTITLDTPKEIKVGDEVLIYRKISSVQTDSVGDAHGLGFYKSDVVYILPDKPKESMAKWYTCSLCGSEVKKPISCKLLEKMELPERFEQKYASGDFQTNTNIQFSEMKDKINDLITYLKSKENLCSEKEKKQD